jgi:hypothetical protein
VYDTVIETDRERDDKLSQFEGPKVRCRSKRSFSIQSVIVTPFPRVFSLNERPLGTRVSSRAH